MKTIKTLPLNKNVKNRLFKFMDQDRISHFYAIYDLKHLKEKTLAWAALIDNEIAGYLMEYDKRILYMRGNPKSVLPLLKNSDLTTPWFNIEPQHLPAVKRLYRPTGPADKATLGLITTFTTMKATTESFTPVIRHDVIRLMKKDAQALAELLGAEPQRARDLLRGIGFGIFKGNKLVSAATSPEMLEDLAIIRGVCTKPEERSKGYATSACSALVQALLQQNKDAMLYVSKDNPAAIKVYKKIGFKETGHTLLGFTAQRKETASQN